MNSIKLKAPAKINLFLQIIGKRPDGYTEIRTLMQAVSLYDRITVERTGSDLVLSCDDPSVPLDSSNTVARAWAVLCKTVGSESGARIHIEKNIPLESGLGGGSSDAAAALIGLSKLYGLRLNRKTLEALGGVVGSDVPFFFGSGSSLAEGRGERLADVGLPMDYGALLVMPEFGMPTREAYDAVKKTLTVEGGKTKLKVLNSAMEAWELCKRGNDFDELFAERFPDAMEIKKRLMDAGALCAALSGSGSAFFGIFDNLDSARAAGDEFNDLWNAAVTPVGIDYSGLPN